MKHLSLYFFIEDTIDYYDCPVMPVSLPHNIPRVALLGDLPKPPYAFPKAGKWELVFDRKGYNRRVAAWEHKCGLWRQRINDFAGMLLQAKWLDMASMGFDNRRQLVNVTAKVIVHRDGQNVQQLAISRCFHYRQFSEEDHLRPYHELEIMKGYLEEALADEEGTGRQVQERLRELEIG